MHTKFKHKRPRKSQSEKQIIRLINLLYPEEYHLDNLAISGRVILMFKMFYL
jgi:hypothetical protein